MSKPTRNQIYDAVIRRMVTEALMEKEKQFAADHVEESDEMLLSYLRQCARELEHTPWPKEIIGWQLITERFGSWKEAVVKAGLPLMSTPNISSKSKLYQQEIEQQQRQYRMNRAKKKEKSIQRMKEQKKRKEQREQKTDK